MARPLPRLPGARVSAPADIAVHRAAAVALAADPGPPEEAPPPRVTVLGVRHHGPGSARSVGAALDRLQPDAVLIEGPPEGEAVLSLAADPTLIPPVALLLYVPDEPRRAGFWPFASFSPEWVALQHALARDVPVRFIDLPAVHSLAPGAEDGERAFGGDPLGQLSRAAGHEDPERFWEDVVEHRRDQDPFAAVAEAMGELRDGHTPPPSEQRREAAMRRAIRTALKEGFSRVAVVCGAWHAPVLEPSTFPSQSADNAVLKGLAKVKVAATWVPWTADRLAFSSGYGAGVRSPGWYEHLFTAPDEAVLSRWLVKVGGLLRDEGLDASSAQIIDAVRLAEALGTLRERPLAGLEECDDAAQAVLAGGDPLTLELIGRKLTVGDALGQVPEATPMVPLQQDLARLQRRLRFKPGAGQEVKELDLRKATDLERSHLLHRLGLLDVPWGQRVGDQVRSTGTFRETWQLSWEPELAVRLIEAGRWGTTLAAAAAARVASQAAHATSLQQLTELVESSLLAELPAAVVDVMAQLQAMAAHDGDVGRLMDAVVPLARVRRYGSVRRADAEALADVVHGVTLRVCAGLVAACASLDDDAAEEMLRRVDGVNGALATLQDPSLTEAWRGALARLSVRDGLHGLLAGRTSRLLLDAGELSSAEAGLRLSRALSVGTEPGAGAAWIEGFLAGSALVLLHDPALLGLIDAWLSRVPPDTFEDLLVLLRRTFSTWPVGERRQLGSTIRTLGSGNAAAAAARAADDDLDLDRAALVLPKLAAILG